MVAVVRERHDWHAHARQRLALEVVGREDALLTSIRQAIGDEACAAGDLALLTVTVERRLPAERWSSELRAGQEVKSRRLHPQSRSGTIIAGDHALLHRLSSLVLEVPTARAQSQQAWRWAARDSRPRAPGVRVLPSLEPEEARAVRRPQFHLFEPNSLIESSEGGGGIGKLALVDERPPLLVHETRHLQESTQ